MTARSVSFRVLGDPATKGSLKPGRGKLRNDNPREATWSAQVAWAARQAMNGDPMLTGPIKVGLLFHMPLPETPTYDYPVVGDLDKLVRSVLDAMSKIVYVDDKHVVSFGMVDKIFAVGDEKPGCMVRVVQAFCPPWRKP